MNIVWFKKDLRVHDHPALAAAAARGPVLPVYIVEPALWQQADAFARHWEFIADCLDDLHESLAARGQPLIVRIGEAVQVLEQLRLEHGATALWSHEETGNDWSYQRDKACAAWARKHGVVWAELPQCGVIRRLASRNGWAKRRNEFMAQPQIDAPVLEPLPN